MTLLIGTSISKALFAGNRGSLIQIFSIIILAYVMSGREFKTKQVAVSGAIMAVLMVTGMIYGTTFRTSRAPRLSRALTAIPPISIATFDEVGRNNNAGLMEFAFVSMAERLDAVSSLAVVVSTYEQLRPYEESYGLDNNIWKDTTTFFIPRVIWPDKPVASEPRRYSDLYFNFGESSFVITPMGDLLRNFGIVGVPIGMLLLGIILRAIYRTLIEDQPRVLWKSSLYFMLLTAVSYESFFGSIIPYLFKIGITALVGVFMVNFMARRIAVDLIVAIRLRDISVTDKNWQVIGERMPYFGVILADEFKPESLERRLPKTCFLPAAKSTVSCVFDWARRYFDKEFQPSRCLDFGCGVGRLVVPFAKKVPQVVGVDVSKGMLEEARRNCERIGLRKMSSWWSRMTICRK